MDDLATALPVMKWNVGEFLPPAIRQYFETSVALFVWEPWHEAALKAAAEGRAAPSLDEVTAASETFFEGLFSTKVLPSPSLAPTPTSTLTLALTLAPTLKPQPQPYPSPHPDPSPNLALTLTRTPTLTRCSSTSTRSGAT